MLGCLLAPCALWLACSPSRCPCPSSFPTSQCFTATRRLDRNYQREGGGFCPWSSRGESNACLNGPAITSNRSPGPTALGVVSQLEPPNWRNHSLIDLVRCGQVLLLFFLLFQKFRTHHDNSQIFLLWRFARVQVTSTDRQLKTHQLLLLLLLVKYPPKFRRLYFEQAPEQI